MGLIPPQIACPEMHYKHTQYLKKKRSKYATLALKSGNATCKMLLLSLAS